MGGGVLKKHENNNTHTRDRQTAANISLAHNAAGNKKQNRGEPIEGKKIDESGRKTHARTHTHTSKTGESRHLGKDKNQRQTAAPNNDGRQRVTLRIVRVEHTTTTSVGHLFTRFSFLFTQIHPHADAADHMRAQETTRRRKPNTHTH